jgi:hypothetical protein
MRVGVGPAEKDGTMSDLSEMFGEVISSYSRAQAIEDGVLIDVSATAKEAGFSVPTVVTSHVWAECVAVPAGCEGTQDESGRLWDVCWMAMVAARKGQNASRVKVELYVVKHEAREAELVELVMAIGPGDSGEPVITIMFPEDD